MAYVLWGYCAGTGLIGVICLVAVPFELLIEINSWIRLFGVGIAAGILALLVNFFVVLRKTEREMVLGMVKKSSPEIVECERSRRMISVIVPVYNRKETLERCVQSLRGQTYSDLKSFWWTTAPQTVPGRSATPWPGRTSESV